MATAKKAAPQKTAASTKVAPTARGRAQDRALVSGHEGYEVSYLAKHTGTTAAQVKAALVEAGHARVKVTKALAAAKKTK